MRKLLLILALFPLMTFGQILAPIMQKQPSGGGGGDPAFGGVLYSNAVTTSANPVVLTTVTNSAPAGSTVVLMSQNGNAITITSVSDSHCGGTWAVDKTVDAAGSPTQIAHTLCPNGLAAGQTVSVTYSSGTYTARNYVIAYATNASGGLDVGNACTANAFDSPYSVTCSITTIATKTIVFYGEMVGNAAIPYTPAGGWTAGTPIQNGDTDWLYWGYKAVSAAGGQDPAGTGNAPWTYRMVVGAYK